MAKKGNDDTDLDKIDLDDFDFDIPEFDSPDVDSTSRSPITRALKGTIRGVKENITSPSTLRRAVTMALPEGYGMAADFVDGAITDTKELYDKITGESPELIRSSKSFGRKVSGKLDKVLPAGIAKKLNTALEDNDYTADVKSDSQLRKESEDSDIAALSSMFKAKASADESRAKSNQTDKLETKALEQARFEDQSKYLSSMNRGIARLVGYQDNITLKFQQKSLELQYRQYSAAKQLTDLMAVATEKNYKILEQIKHNTALPEVVKVRGSEMFGQLAKQKLMGGALNTFSDYTQNYRGHIIKNVGNVIQGALSPMQDAQQMTEGMDKADIGGWVLGQELSNGLMNKASVLAQPFLDRNKGVKRVGEQLRNKFQDAPQTLNEWATSETKRTGWKGWLERGAKAIAPKHYFDTRAAGTNPLELDEPTMFDKVSRRTLIEVIPGFLSEIAHYTKMTATGDMTAEKQVYNHVRGGFTSEETNKRNVASQIMSTSEREGIRQSVNDFMSRIGGEVLSPKAYRILQRKLMDEAANGKQLIPKRLADPDEYDGADAAAVDEVTSLIIDTFSLDYEGNSTDTSTEGLARFNDTSRVFAELQRMIPAIGDRTRVLSDTLGRDTMRSLGFIERSGNQDQLNKHSLYDLALDDEKEQASPGSQGGKKTPPDRNGRINPFASGHDVVGENLSESAARADRIDDFSGKRSSSKTSKVNLEKYLGSKSLLIGILRESRDQHIQTVKGLDSMYQVMLGWDLSGFRSATPGDVTGPGKVQGFLNRFKGFKRPTVEQGRSFLNRMGSGIGNRLGGLTGGAIGLAGRGAWTAAGLYKDAMVGSAKLGWGATKGIAGGLYGGAKGILGYGGEKLRGTFSKENMTGAKDWAAGQFKSAKDSVKDLWIKGVDHPVLEEWKMKAGLYKDEATGAVIKKWTDITSNVIEGKKKIALSWKDYQESGGLRDSKGKVIAKATSLKNDSKQAWADRGKYAQSGMDKASSMFDTARSWVGGIGNPLSALTNPFQTAGKIAVGGYRKIMRVFGGGKLGSNITSQLTGEHDKDIITLNIRQAQLQYEIYHMLKKKLDPAEIRKNSWQDLFRKREAKDAEKNKLANEAKYGKTGGLGSLGALFSGLLGKKGKFGGGDDEDDDGFGLDDAGDIADIYDAANGDGRSEKKGKKRGKRGRRGRGKVRTPRPGPGNAPKGKFGRAMKFARGIGSGALDMMGSFGQGIRNTGSFIGKAARGVGWVGKQGYRLGKFALTNPVSRFAGKTALKTVGKVALGALVGVGGVLSSPVVGAALAAWTVYEVGDWLWTRYKDKLPPLARLRFAQYGFSPRKDTVGLDKIFALENMFSKYARVEESGAVTVNMKGIPAEQFSAILGFKVDPGNEETMEHLQKVMAWVKGRFITTYSAHLGQLYKLNKSMDLAKADETVKGQQKLDYLNAVRLKEADDQFDQMNGPFEDDLTEDAGDVDDWFDSAMSDAKSELKDSKPDDKNAKEPQTGVAAALAGNAAGVGTRFGLNKGGNGTTASGTPILDSAVAAGGKFTPTIALGAALAGGATVVGAASMQMNPGDKRLDFGNPVRYKVYGLTELAEAKVVQLSQLESASFPLVKYDQEKRAFIGNENDLFNAFTDIFGLNDKNQDDAYVWFYRRYLVAFLKYCTAVRAKAQIDAKDAIERLSNEDLLAVLKEMVAAKTDGGTSVWDIKESPWEGYWLNSDSESVAANLTGLANRTMPKLLSDAGLKDAKQVKGADGSLIKVDPTQTNRPEGTSSTSTTGVPGAAAAASGGTSWFDSLKAAFSDDSKKQAQTGTDFIRVKAATADASGGSAVAKYGGQAAVGATETDQGGPVSHMGGGSGGDVNSLPMPTGNGWDANKATILAAAKMVGVDPALAASIAGVESNYNPTARPYSKKLGKYLSSAAGYYQVIKDTWKSLMGTYGAKYGINPNATAMDPRANALLGLSYVKENYDVLSAKVNRKVTDTDVYLAHFLGLGGAKRFLTAPPGDPAINHVGASQASSNPTIFYDSAGRPRTVADVYNDFSKKLNIHRKPDALKDMQAMMPGGAVTPDASSAEGEGSSVPEGDLVGPVQPGAVAASTGGGGAFDPVNEPKQAPSLAQPQGQSIPQPNSVMDTPADAATQAASTTRVSQAAQTISQQAEIADIQSSNQTQAISNSFGGVEGVLRESLEVNKQSLGKLTELVGLVSNMAQAGSALTPLEPPSPLALKSDSPIKVPRGTVSVARK